jgi:methyltransferase (TIGR00027 family)
MGTALMRAAHTRLDRPTLIDDPWGDRLILAEEREAFQAAVGSQDLDDALRAHPSYGTVIIRTRHAEDALADAVDRGVRQYVIIGAGMDSFALRRLSFVGELKIFEIDHPATQEFKRRRFASCGVPEPARWHLVPADLNETGLDVALASSPFRSDQPAFFSWLGVSTYLTRAANLATLAAITACAAADSELVFSYVDQGVLDSADHRLQRARARVAAAGEPWLSGFDPNEIGPELRSAGLELVEDLGPEQLQARYCAGRSDGLTAGRGSHVARARVAGPARSRLRTGAALADRSAQHRNLPIRHKSVASL